jgi:hypothetical protein
MRSIILCNIGIAVCSLVTVAFIFQGNTLAIVLASIAALGACIGWAVADISQYRRDAIRREFPELQSRKDI